MSDAATLVRNCPGCQAKVPPTALRCPSCDRPIEANLGGTAKDPTDDFELPPGHFVLTQPDLRRPGPDELPPSLWKTHLALLAFVLLAGVILNFPMHAVNRPVQFRQWIQACTGAFRDRDGAGRSHWRSVQEIAPAAASAVYVLNDPQRQEPLVQQLLSDLPLRPYDELRVPPVEWSGEVLASLRHSARENDWIVVRMLDTPLDMHFETSLYTVESKGLATFMYGRSRGPLSLYINPAMQLTACLALALAGRALVVGRYRRRRHQEYAAWEATRTRAVFKLREQWERARGLAESGERETALILLNKILACWPGYEEAASLRRGLSQAIATATTSAAPVLGAVTSAERNSLYLRIIGTPYAYAAVPGADRVSVGRQRRKPGETADVGNDFVIRVPGESERTLRISRRQFDISRVGDDHFIIDRSTAGTRLNGQELPRDHPVRIRSGDHLSVADTLTLEVLVRSDVIPGASQPAVTLAADANRAAELIVEASIGDMRTVE